MRIRVTQGPNVFWVVPTVTAGKAGCFVLPGIGLGNLVCFGDEGDAEDMPDDRTLAVSLAIKGAAAQPCTVACVREAPFWVKP